VQDYRVYGLTSSGAVTLSENHPSMPIDEIRSLAHSRLEQCEEVEVWQGPVRILRLRRG